MPDWPVTYRRKIRFSDSDAQGIVFNANYATYFDDTITDYLEALGIPWHQLSASGHELVLARSEIDYTSAGRIGDVLVTGARISRRGRTSLEFQLETWNEHTNTTVARGRLIQVVVDSEHFRPVSVPEFLVAAVERFQGDPLPE